MHQVRRFRLHQPREANQLVRAADIPWVSRPPRRRMKAYKLFELGVKADRTQLAPIVVLIRYSQVGVES